MLANSDGAQWTRGLDGKGEPNKTASIRVVPDIISAFTSVYVTHQHGRPVADPVRHRSLHRRQAILLPIAAALDVIVIPSAKAQIIMADRVRWKVERQIAGERTWRRSARLPPQPMGSSVPNAKRCCSAERTPPRLGHRIPAWRLDCGRWSSHATRCCVPVNRTKDHYFDLGGRDSHDKIIAVEQSRDNLAK